MMKKRSSLCPGFRFHPTDVELAMYYLKRKLLGKNLVPEVIAEVKIYDFHPRDLPDKSNLRNGDLEWFFFCPKLKRYSNGSRTNRATETGYWKATGKDREVKYNGKIVAWIKTLVFHLGRPPKGERTDWVMHEYRMEDKDLADAGLVQDAYVLCKLFEKSGAGPKNGAQYGAPFEEEDWDDDDDDDDDEAILLNPASSSVSNMTRTDPGPSTTQSFENTILMEEILAASSAFGSASTPVSFASTSAEPGFCSSAVMNMTSAEPGPSTKASVPFASSSENASHHLPTNDDVMLPMFTDEDVALIINNNTQDVHVELDRKGKKVVTDVPNDDEVLHIDPGDFFELDDLSQDGFNKFQDATPDFAFDPFPTDYFDADELF